MPSQGPLYPGTRFEQSYSGADRVWTNETNIGADDGNEARSSDLGIGPTHQTYDLIGTNFGFSIPTGATIDGIEVTIERGGSATYEDYRVHTVQGGTVGGTNKSTGTNLPGPGNATNTFGGSSDLWGRSWTPADINASNFGAAYAAQKFNYPAGQAVDVDYVRITVHYTEAAGAEGTAAQTLPSVLQSGSGAVEVSGDSAQTLPRVTQAASGTVESAGVAGTAAQTLPSLTQSAAGAVAIAATCAQTLPALSQASAASVPSNGTAAQTLPSLTQAATGAISVAGQASQTLPAIVQAAAGKAIVGGDGASLLPSVTQAAAGRVYTPVVSIVCIEALDVFCPSAEAVEAADVFSPHIIAGVFHPAVEASEPFSPSIDGDVFTPQTEAAQGGCHP